MADQPFPKPEAEESLEEVSEQLFDAIQQLLKQEGEVDVARLVKELTQKLSETGLSQSTASLLGEDNLTVLSSLVYQLVREAVAKNTFQQVDGSPWPTAALQSGKARGPGSATSTRHGCRVAFYFRRN